MSQTDSVSTETASHYRWAEVCDGWHLLAEPDLSVIEEQVPPGIGEVRHFHSQARQFFYILSGRACMEFADRVVALAAGQGLHVPPGVSHRFLNPTSDQPVRFLVVSAPSTRGDRTNLG